jgi:DNA-binding GntR family transcriptional regulator
MNTVPQASLGSIAYKSLVALSYEALRRALLRGQFGPGEQLNLSQLAIQFGVSQTPLKEAVRLLADQGLLEIRARHGTFVKPITERELAAAVEARFMVESWAIRNARQRMDQGDWRRLEQLLLAVDELLENNSGDPVELQDRFTELDFEFHASLVRACCNPPLARLYESLGTHFQLARAWLLEDSRRTVSRMAEGSTEHREIHRLLGEGLIDEAVESLDLHIRRSLERAIALIREHGGAI